MAHFTLRWTCLVMLHKFIVHTCSKRTNECLSRAICSPATLILGNSVYGVAYLMSQFGGCWQRHGLYHIDLAPCVTASDQHAISYVTSRWWLSSLLFVLSRQRRRVTGALRRSPSRTSARLHRRSVVQRLF